MSSGDALVLRDIHTATPPSWWPPAPGWWLLALVLAAALAAGVWWRRRREARAQRIAALFDAAMQTADSPAARVAAMSELLRRASRRIDKDADRLDGDAWLAFLDQGLDDPVFREGAGHLLLEGGYRPEVAEADSEALQAVARARFIDWMQRR